MDLEVVVEEGSYGILLVIEEFFQRCLVIVVAGPHSEKVWNFLNRRSWFAEHAGRKSSNGGLSSERVVGLPLYGNLSGEHAGRVYVNKWFGGAANGS